MKTMKITKTMKVIPSVAVALLVAGCKVGPDFRAPAAQVPPAYAGSALVQATQGEEAVRLEEWWTVFGDPHLASIIHTVAEANLDVRLAAARVREAKAQRGFTRAGLFPQAGSSAAYSRSRPSENTLNGRQAAAAGQGLESDLFDAGLDVSWEIDLFGGTRRAVEAAQAEWEASVESAHAVTVTILAEAGLSYLDLRGAERQLMVARDNLRAQRDTLALTEDRFRAGLASELDQARAAAQVAATRAQIPPLEEAKTRAILRLAVLLGQSPGEWAPPHPSGAAVLAAPPRVPVGLPSDLLRQRPDIRRAERRLAAATARIGQATAELFPKFYLTGAAGLQSVDAGDFFEGGSRFWSLAPSIRWPIFTAGRIRQNIQVQNARQEQAALEYEQAILASLEEVENALMAFGQEQERHEALREFERASHRSAALAEERYRGGLADFLDVLEAQRSLLAAQDSVVQSDRRLGQNLILLFKALGGGWTPESEPKLAQAR